MAVVDRSVLRLAGPSSWAQPDVPMAVVINEAVELANDYSTDESGRFVNGVLATVAAGIRGYDPGSRATGRWVQRAGCHRPPGPPSRPVSRP